ncbi:MAG TPA: DUF4157 domain-containing protein, partial [Fimbriimonadaceae bacterium]|nr:DUF4157 domain-containing protein [Fimbriimonadaceae bacterium]
MDAAEDLGSAISDRVQAFGDAVTSGAQFSKEIGARAIGAGQEVAAGAWDQAKDAGAAAVQGVGDTAHTIGAAGQAAWDFGAGALNKGIGLAKSGIDAVSGALADPEAAVRQILASGARLITSAVGTARSTITGLIHSVQTEVESVVATAGAGAEALARKIAGGVGAVAQFAGKRLIIVVHQAVEREQKKLRLLGPRLKEPVAEYAQRLRMMILVGATGIHLAAKMAAFGARVAIIDSATVAQRTLSLVALSAKARVDATTTRISKSALQAAASVAKASMMAQAMVRSSIGAIAPYLPASLRGLAYSGLASVTAGSNAIMAFAISAGAAASTLATTAARRIDRAILLRWGMALPEIRKVEMELLVDVAAGEKAANEKYVRGVQASLVMLLLDREYEAAVDEAIGWAGGQLKTIDKEAPPAISGAANAVSTGAEALEAKGEQLAGGALGSAKSGTKSSAHGAALGARTASIVSGGAQAIGEGAKAVGLGAAAFGDRIVHGAGELAWSAADQGIAFATGTLARATKFSQTKQANDGDLTGPFFPGDPMPDSGKVGGLHGSGSPASREKAIASGANLFVNGIDTTLADHYRAAQRLANTLNTTVVGVYNATAGMKSDLLQCAGDKLFDRSGNPAVGTVARLIRTYGDARKPQGGMQIFAHSQGSLIVSEALRQAKTTGSDLSQNEVTTLGNAAFTYPAGPKYHHYIHDDDAVSMSVGTGSAISNVMNNTGVGKSLSQLALGQTADVSATTVTLHHGGSGIEPHAINAPNRHDYIGDLSKFRAQEAKGLPVAQATPVWKRSMEASGFALARAAGSAAANKVATGYDAVDSRIRSMPSLPGLPPNLIWGGIDRRLRSIGGSALGLGGLWGGLSDAAFSGLSAVQRSEYVSARTPDQEHRVVASLAANGDVGFAPDKNVREKLAPHLGFDPSFARLHDAPASASAAQALGAHAFAIGQDIHFGAGEYDPHSPKGLALIGHELTHVAQQASGRPRPLNFSRDVGATGDLMEAEAQTVAARILSDVGSRDAFHVEQFSKIYEAAEGVGSADSRRLDRIGEMAIAKATEIVGRKSGIVEQVSVSIELDLGRMNDDEASGIWAEAIVAQVNLLDLKPPVVPTPARIQKDDKAPPQKERHLPKDTETAIEQDAGMVHDELDKFLGPDWLKISDAFERWRNLDQDTQDKYDDPTKHMDTFLVRLQIRSLDKGYLASQFTTVLDDLLRRDESYYRFLKDTKNYKDYKADRL